MSITDKELEDILNDEPTQDELDAAAKDFIGRHVMPARTAPLPKPPTEDEEYAEFDNDGEDPIASDDIEDAKRVAPPQVKNPAGKSDA